MDRGNFFSPLAQHQEAQGHPLKLSVGIAKTDKGKYLFTQEILCGTPCHRML